MVSHSNRGTKSISRKAKFKFGQGLCHHGGHCYAELAARLSKLEERVSRERKKPHLKLGFLQLIRRRRPRAFLANVESYVCHLREPHKVAPDLILNCYQSICRAPRNEQLGVTRRCCVTMLKSLKF